MLYDEWIEAEGTRLQRGSNGRLRPLKRWEDLKHRPAESECLQRKGTTKL